MTQSQKGKHYYVSFEDSRLFRSFLASNDLEVDQVSVIRNPQSSLLVPMGETIFVLGKPGQDSNFELDWARITRECVIRVIDPFDRVANQEQFSG